MKNQREEPTNGRLNQAEIKFLKELFETKIDAIEKATTLAQENLRVRLESMNEFRAQMKDQAGTFVSRAEFDAKLEHINDDKRANISLWISLLAVIVGIISIVVRLR